MSSFNAQFGIVRAAIHRLLSADDDPAPEIGLARLAEFAGWSDVHFQKVFTRWAGISPKRFLQFARRNRAVAALRTPGNLLDAALEARLSRPGRLHGLLIHCDAVTPGQAMRRGAGVSITVGQGFTPWGMAQVAWTARGICGLHFLPEDDQTPALDLQTNWPAAEWTLDDTQAQATLDRVFGDGAYLPLHLHGTNFQLQVWQALLQIPQGQTCSYTEIAHRINRPRAARAVAAAIARNDIAVLIPCHRVIRDSGVLAGYRWGLARKVALLIDDAAQAPPSQ
jgi:AraC family transcriptional regulator of adaptative response/methylated-DNA-[protein]-cysteine methyltransferase